MQTLSKRSTVARGLRDGELRVDYAVRVGDVDDNFQVNIKAGFCSKPMKAFLRKAGKQRTNGEETDNSEGKKRRSPDGRKDTRCDVARVKRRELEKMGKSSERLRSDL